MKRIIYCLAILGITFVGCNPMEDIYDGLDSTPDPIVGTEFYTLTDEDYSELELGFGSFSSEEDAKTMLPAFLADKYPFWGEGSSVTVGYDLYIGNAEGINDFTDSDIYEFTNADYATTGSDAFGFYPNVNALGEIPSVLDAQIETPEEGQMVLVKYNHYTEVPEVGVSSLETYNFNGSLDDFESISVIGDDQTWYSSSYNGIEYAKMSGYDSGVGSAFANEDWLISPEIDLDEESNVSLQISQAINFADDLSLINVMVSSDYTTGGDATTATWEVLNFTTAPAGNSYDYILSENYDLSAYDGETIHVALKYESTTDDAATWQIDFLSVNALGITGDYDAKGVYFVYEDGAWEEMDNVYFLSSADYDSMGEDFGQPGRFDNFSSSISPNNYLPSFLHITFPYAQEEDELFVIYDYYSSNSGAQRRGNFYTVIGGEFVAHQSTISTTLQFGVENGVWVPDNTIRYTFTDADYAAAAAALADVYPGPSGSMANYGNMDRRPGHANEWTNPMVLDAIAVVLDIIDPSAQDEQKYVITVNVYNGSNTTEDFAVIKSGGEWVYQN